MVETGFTAAAFDSLALNVMATWHEPLSLNMLLAMLSNEFKTQSPQVTMGDVLGSIQRLKEKNLIRREMRQHPDPEMHEFEVWTPTKAGHLRARAIDEHAPEPQPSHAVVRIGEDSLDGWWDELDVDVKAEVFLHWSLDQHTSFNLDEEPSVSIPMAGVANCTAEFDQRLRDRVAAAPAQSGDVYGAEWDEMVHRTRQTGTVSQPGERIIDRITKAVDGVEALVAARAAITQADGAVEDDLPADTPISVTLPIYAVAEAGGAR